MRYAPLLSTRVKSLHDISTMIFKMSGHINLFSPDSSASAEWPACTLTQGHNLIGRAVASVSHCEGKSWNFTTANKLTLKKVTGWKCQLPPMFVNSVKLKMATCTGYPVRIIKLERYGEDRLPFKWLHLPSLCTRHLCYWPPLSGEDYVNANLLGWCWPSTHARIHTHTHTHTHTHKCR